MTAFSDETGRVSIGVDFGSGDQTALTLRHGDLVFAFVGQEAEAIAAALSAAPVAKEPTMYQARFRESLLKSSSHRWWPLMTDTLVGSRPWTQEDFWEYLGAYVGEFEAGQIKTMLGEQNLVIVPTANPADFRYWEGRYRDEKARALAAESSLSEAVKAEREACAKVADAKAIEFLSPEYKTGQPFSSFNERFACEQVASAIRSRAAVLDSERGSTHEA